MHDELELKLAVTPRELKRLRADPLIRSLATQRANTKRLHSTYFDTKALELRQRGMSLRIRQIGRRRVQTLKVPGHGESGLQHYREYEAEVASEQPNVELIQDDHLRELLYADGLASRLEPLFVTAFSRAAVPLKLDDSEVELALDQGEILANGHRLAICEAELELVSGDSERILELALALHKRIGFRLETRTKAARGYQLSRDLRARPRKAQRLELEPKMTVATAFARVARNCLSQIRHNEAVVLADLEQPRDPEGIHQLRVGVRRLRALVTVFRKALAPDVHALLREELSWLQSALGPAREWDVFVLEHLAPLRRRLPEDADLAGLAKVAEARREQANLAAKAALGEARYTDLLLRLELWLMTGAWASRAGGHHDPGRPVRRYAAEALNRRAAKLHKLTRKWKTLPEAELHDVRILAKKLRYTAEFFETL